jgi:hypothetical protein
MRKQIGLAVASVVGAWFGGVAEAQDYSRYQPPLGQPPAAVAPVYTPPVTAMPLHAMPRPDLLAQPAPVYNAPTNVLPPPSMSPPAVVSPISPGRQPYPNMLQTPLGGPNVSAPVNGTVLPPPQLSSPQPYHSGMPPHMSPMQPHISPVPQHHGPLVPYSTGCDSCAQTGPSYFGGYSDCSTSCCAGRRGCYAAIGVYYVKPHWEENPAYGLFVGGLSTTVDYDWDYQWSPRAVAGFTTCEGLGVRGRAWLFDHEPETLAFRHTPGDGLFTALPLGLDASPLGLIFPNLITSADYLFDSDLDLEVYDFEATLEAQLCNCTITASGGARFADLRQGYWVRAEGTTSDGAIIVPPTLGRFDVDLRSRSTFRGYGPTAALEVHHGLNGHCGTGCSSFGVYGSARGSVLFGTAKQNVRLVVNQFNLAGGQTASSSSLAAVERDDVISVLELELGVEYSTFLGCHRVFVQAGVVGQVWYGAGNAAHVDEFLLPDNHTNLGFFGLTAVGGVEF